MESLFFFQQLKGIFPVRFSHQFVAVPVAEDDDIVVLKRIRLAFPNLVIVASFPVVVVYCSRSPSLFPVLFPFPLLLLLIYRCRRQDSLMLLFINHFFLIL